MTYSKKCIEMKRVLDDCVFETLKKHPQKRLIAYRHDALKNVYLPDMNDLLLESDAIYHVEKTADFKRIVIVINIKDESEVIEWQKKRG